MTLAAIPQALPHPPTPPRLVTHTFLRHGRLASEPRDPPVSASPRAGNTGVIQSGRPQDQAPCLQGKPFAC